MYSVKATKENYKTIYHVLQASKFKRNRDLESLSVEIQKSSNSYFVLCDNVWKLYSHHMRSIVVKEDQFIEFVLHGKISGNLKIAYISEVKPGQKFRFLFDDKIYTRLQDRSGDYSYFNKFYDLCKCDTNKGAVLVDDNGKDIIDV